MVLKSILIKNFTRLSKKSAGFDYTKDQKKVFQRYSFDLSSGRVMDRLLSGDVGFVKQKLLWMLY